MKGKNWIFGAAAAVVAVGSGAHAATTTQAASTTNTPPAYVVKIAEQQAKENGGPTPTGAVAVDTTRGAAMHAAAGGVDGSQIPVWLVVLHGHFKDRNASVPAGQPLPTGQVILFTINKRTHQIMDFGIGNRPPALSSLGPVEHISMP